MDPPFGPKYGMDADAEWLEFILVGLGDADFCVGDDERYNEELEIARPTRELRSDGRAAEKERLWWIVGAAEAGLGEVWES